MSKFLGYRLKKKLLRARDAWMEVMASHRDERGLVCPPVPPMLEDQHLAKCKVLASRDGIISEMPRGGRVAELGVLAGDFSQILLETCSPSRLHLVDLALGSHGVPERFSEQVEAGSVVLHEGESWKVMGEFPDEYFDFVYVDADHSYEGVKKDIGVAKRKIRREGFLIFNDYTYWSPVECIPYGVMHAVNELCLNEGWEVRFFALDPYMYCDVAIRRMASVDGGAGGGGGGSSPQCLDA